MKLPPRLPITLAFLLLLGGLLPSCETLPLSERRYISQPAMLFDGKGGDLGDCVLLTQVESGRLGTGGAAGAGCSSCH